MKSFAVLLFALFFVSLAAADITIVLDQYPPTGKTVKYVLAREADFFLLSCQGKEFARGDTVDLSSSLTDLEPTTPLVNHLSLSKCGKEVFASGAKGPGSRSLYIQGTDGEIELVMLGREWRLAIVSIEAYKGGKYFTFSLYPWPGDRLNQFSSSFLSLAYSGNFVEIDEGVPKVGKTANHSRFMLSPEDVNGQLVFQGEKDKFVLSYPMAPDDFVGKLADGTQVFPTRVSIKNNIMEAWKISAKGREILKTFPFIDISGQLELKADGLTYKVFPVKIDQQWEFVMEEVWPQGNNIIVDIGNQLRFSCLSTPNGARPEVKLFAIEQNVGAIPVRE